MEYGTYSENLVWLAKWVAIASLLLVALLSFQIVLLRARLQMRLKRERRLYERWQPYLVACLEGPPNRLPVLAAKDIETFLVLWNYFHETLRDAGKENLNIIAYRLKLDSWSLNALEHGSIRERLLAIQTLGWLKKEEAWDPLSKIMRDADPVTALCAAKALIRIEPKKGVCEFIPLIPDRPAWSYSTVGKLLREVGGEIVTDPLIEEASKRDNRELVRLLRFIDIAYTDKSAPLLSKILRKSDDINVINSCLRSVVEPRDLRIVRRFLKHEDWRVRTQAAICLGRIGTARDASRLAHAAGDQEWWVRYRAALALASLPNMTAKKLKRIADKHQNFFASDIINKVRLEVEAF